MMILADLIAIDFDHYNSEFINKSSELALDQIDFFLSNAIFFFCKFITLTLQEVF